MLILDIRWYWDMILSIIYFTLIFTSIFSYNPYLPKWKFKIRLEENNSIFSIFSYRNIWVRIIRNVKVVIFGYIELHHLILQCPELTFFLSMNNRWCHDTNFFLTCKREWWSISLPWTKYISYFYFNWVKKLV